MADAKSKFEQLCEINVNEYTEKKNQLTYLSWANAWKEFKKQCPDARYEIVKNQNHLPYFHDPKSGYFVFTRVTVGDETHEMLLPVMNNKNQAVTEADAFLINKNIMRCLTKNMAMFGFGLYIYAGEDLPDGEEEKPQAPKPIIKARKIYSDLYSRKKNNDKTSFDVIWEENRVFIDTLAVSDNGDEVQAYNEMIKLSKAFDAFGGSTEEGKQ